MIVESPDSSAGAFSLAAVGDGAGYSREESSTTAFGLVIVTMPFKARNLDEVSGARNEDVFAHNKARVVKAKFLSKLCRSEPAVTLQRRRCAQVRGLTILLVTTTSNCWEQNSMGIHSTLDTLQRYGLSKLPQATAAALPVCGGGLVM